eukprot:m.351092 g.351092  ORF g.351092 m.351092 type:complete len:55 (+) comp27973_c0_seq7:266-430(+)
MRQRAATMQSLSSCEGQGRVRSPSNGVTNGRHPCDVVSLHTDVCSGSLITRSNL